MRLPKYYSVDLSAKSISEYPISEDSFRKYLGGKALAAKIILEETEPGGDPLAPDATIIINTGPMNGTQAPASSRFNLTFKNVLTGGIGTSNCGGSFGLMLKKTGIDGIIIKGKADNLSIIKLINGNLEVEEREDLKGLNTEETQKYFPKNFGKLVIGPAGENLVNYACAVSGERVAGRCGAGAVLGSKNIKAIVSYGTMVEDIFDPKGFKEYNKKWIEFLKKHPMTGEILPKYGTANLVSVGNKSHTLPTRNFTSGNYEKVSDLSGEELAEKHTKRNRGCISCPIKCERRVMIKGKEVKGLK